ncbi:hypothetical protein PROFUN_08447 [Planoprotostelium fungivorum]|uniref:Uncharacterized protein n=1 Tax=Planoprotostelium fungivorum TaxID=1890364 RepID=A0A2P6N1U4_9EUKA|nr:hypothetical protein PROFUN_08447 [Planoprotostelium fungivorum]
MRTHIQREVREIEEEGHRMQEFSSTMKKPTKSRASMTVHLTQMNNKLSQSQPHASSKLR